MIIVLSLKHGSNKATAHSCLARIVDFVTNIDFVTKFTKFQLFTSIVELIFINSCRYNDFKPIPGLLKLANWLVC